MVCPLKQGRRRHFTDIVVFGVPVCKTNALLAYGLWNTKTAKMSMRVLVGVKRVIDYAVKVSEIVKNIFFCQTNILATPFKDKWRLDAAM